MGVGEDIVKRFISQHTTINVVENLQPMSLNIYCQKANKLKWKSLKIDMIQKIWFLSADIKKIFSNVKNMFQNHIPIIQ